MNRVINWKNIESV